MPLRTTFATFCRDNRIRLRLTQQQLGDAVGVSRGHIANIEIGRANPPLDLVDRIARALDVDVTLVARPPLVMGGGSHGVVHDRCSGFAGRRLGAAGWIAAREVEVIHGRSHGWIDLVAYDSASGTVIVIEIKTRLDDVGAVERQIGWYERSAFDVARRVGWRPRRSVGWLLLLASDEVEAAVRAHRELLDQAFPVRAREMTALLADGSKSISGRGMGLIDPSSHRRDWIIPSRVDGRRSPAPFRDYADAARRFAA